MTGIMNAMLGAGISPPSVTASNVTGSASGLSASGSVSSSTSPNPVVTGGRAPYSYSWARVSGDTPTCIPTNVANPGWSEDAVAAGSPSVSTWRVTVTDADGRTGTADITVTLTWTSLL